jgi:CRISPR-associated protein (TIGR02584 family)
VLGLNPQLLTETLYALATGEEPWIPTEIHAITTRPGADAIRQHLFSLSSPYEQLLSEFLPGVDIAFDDSDEYLHVISRDHRRLEDILDPADSAAAADAILNVILPLVQDDRCEVHASIAGGRKTMGFLLGNLISLLGRPKDSVSHVLISDERFERHPEFFYPSSKYPRTLTFRDGTSARSDSVDVTMAKVPILHFSAELPRLLGEKGLSYEAIFRAAEETLVPKPVIVSPASRTISVAGLSVILEPTLMGWYLFLAQRRFSRAQEAGLVAPGMVRIAKDSAKNIGVSQDALRRAFARVGIVAGAEITADLDNFKEHWTQTVSYVNAAVRDNLPVELAQSLVVVGPGERKCRDGQYGLLNLDPARIRIV